MDEIIFYKTKKASATADAFQFLRKKQLTTETRTFVY
jgi:hypothetical protein